MKTMKNILNEWKKYTLLKEGGLSRLRNHIEEHDCAIITAYRGDANDMSQCAQGAEEPSEGENNQTRNRDLKATLLGMGVGVTKVDGSYVEDFETPLAKEVKESSFFCVNLKDEADFFELIQELGEKYCQDSVLCIPRGGEGAFLLGTNNAEFPGYGKKMEVGKLKYGEEAEFMTRTRGRPMTFAESKNSDIKLETYRDLPRNQRMVVKAITKKFLNS